MTALESFQEHADCRTAIRLLPASSHTLLSILRVRTVEGIGRVISVVEIRYKIGITSIWM